jgi:lysophospholipase L1-like esterase
MKRLSNPSRPGGEQRRGFRGRLRLLIAPLLLVAAFSFPALTSPASAAAAGNPPQYLALGDSLAQGVQPDSTGLSVPTNSGYVDDLYGHATPTHPRLQLAKLGCPGETTSTMRGTSPPICSYPEGNQLNAAAAFLATHRVLWVTIDIGANDVSPCLTDPNPPLCVQTRLAIMAQNLGYILTVLHTVAPTVKIYGMNYYDPYLAAWLSPGGPTGQGLAHQSEVLTEALNVTLLGVYSHFGDKVANVQLAYQTSNFDIVPAFGLPVNVIEICLNTWMCNPSPQGPNVHANDVGYSVIANAFLAVNSHL